MKRILVGGAAAVLLCGAPIAVKLEVAAGGAVFRVVGWAGEASACGDFIVRVEGGSVPLLGSCRAENGALIFQPRFPLQPGIRYRAEFKPANLTDLFEIPKPAEGPATRVEHVYPSASVLPENQLKFYVYFSAPMSRGEAYRRIRLLDQAGNAISLPFLELDEELWDPAGKRLTVFFDPGRVKRGLLPREEAGTPIEEGKSYTLVIDREWVDASNRPLAKSMRKSFRVGPSDQQPPDPKNWRLTPPGGPGEPVTVEFPEPMDRALLDSLLEVNDRRGKPVAGSIEVDREETRWRFTPRTPWKPGEYVVLVGTIIEDLAGNTVNKPFEVDVFERVEARVYRETVQLRFRVPPRSP